MLPQEVSDTEIAFGGDIEKLLPNMDDIPQEFHDAFHNGNNKWVRFVSDIFYGQNGEKWEIDTKDDIDVHLAARHIMAILHSFQPKHEHKIAGCAYLLSQFYNDVNFKE